MSDPNDVRFKLVISTVKPDVTDTIVDAAKAAGATGATIIPGRGTGIREAKTFFGLTLEVQTDMVIMLIEESQVATVLAAISDAGRFQEPGTGIGFVLPVESTVGLESQIERFAAAKRKAGGDQ